MRRISGIIFGSLGSDNGCSIRVQIQETDLHILVRSLVSVYYRIPRDRAPEACVCDFADRFIRPRLSCVEDRPVVVEIIPESGQVTVCFDQSDRAKRGSQIRSALVGDPTFLFSSACVGVKLDMGKIIREVYPDGILAIPEVREVLNLDHDIMEVDPDQCLKVQLEDGRIGYVLLSNLIEAAREDTQVAVTMVGPNMVQYDILDEPIYIPVRPLWDEFLEMVSTRVLQNWTFGQQGDD
jgi:hypothetical protein